MAGDRIGLARDRHLRVWDAVALQHALRPERARVTVPLAGRLEVGRPVSDIEAYERSISRAESWVLKRDSGLGQHRFQNRYLNAHISDELAVRYCQLLAAHLEEDHDRRDRLEFIAARMLSTSGTEGQHVMRWEEARPTLDAICGAFQASNEAKAASSAFFHKAMQRLHEFTSVSEIFESGLMTDVRGFKTALGRDFTDPEILFASTAFTVETADRLAFLADAEGLPRGEVSFRFGKLELELRKLFRDMRTADLRQTAIETVDWHRYKWRQGRGRLKEREEPAQVRPGLRKLFGIVAILGLAIAAASSSVTDDNELVPVFYQSDLENISPLLASGSLSQGNASVFIGALKNGRWKDLSASGRKSEADRIRERLAARRIKAALIHDGMAVAIKIDESNVVVMDGMGGMGR